MALFAADREKNNKKNIRMEIAFRRPNKKKNRKNLTSSDCEEEEDNSNSDSSSSCNSGSSTLDSLSSNDSKCVVSCD